MKRSIETLTSDLLAMNNEDKLEAIEELLDNKVFQSMVIDVIKEKLSNTKSSLDTFNTSTEAQATRMLYVDELNERTDYNIDLSQMGNHSIWAVGTNCFVALPFANEKQPNRWFLGIREHDMLFKLEQNKIAVVLICRSKEGRTLDFVIPTSKVVVLLPKLTLSNGQFKINVKRIDQQYFIMLPDSDPLDITDYMSEVSALSQ